MQEVEIYLNFIGYFAAPVPELTPEEEKRQEYLRKHRMQSREPVSYTHLHQKSETFVLQDQS